MHIYASMHLVARMHQSYLNVAYYQIHLNLPTSARAAHEGIANNDEEADAAMEDAEDIPHYRMVWIKFVRTFFNPRLMIPELIILVVVKSLFALALYIPVDFLPDMMVKELGISELDAGYVISVYGGASLVGRLVSGVVTNLKDNIAIKANCLSMALLGVSCFGMGVSNALWHCIVCASVYGFFQGCNATLFPILLVDMLGLDQLKGAYGLIMFFNGIATLIGAPFAGWLGVAFEGYKYAFFAAGGIYMLAWFLSAIIVCISMKK